MARQPAVLASSLSLLPTSLRTRPNMGPKDLESGGDGSTSEGSRSQEGAGQPKGLRQSLSRAFLSSGLQVTFKASSGDALRMPTGSSRSAAPALAATGFRRGRPPAFRTPFRSTPAPWLLGAAPQDVTYTVVNSQNKKEKISLLQGVGGYLQAGEMAALMG